MSPKLKLDKSTRPSGKQDSNKNEGGTKTVIGTRRFDRPSFLSECFDEPEPQYFYMFKECGCPKLKLTEI